MYSQHRPYFASINAVLGRVMALAVATCVGTAAWITTPVKAQEGNLPNRTAEYLRCADITDVLRRLRCYDDISASLRTQSDVVLDTPITEVPRATVTPAQQSPAMQAEPAPAQVPQPQRQPQTTPSSRDDFGAENLRRDGEEEEPDEIRVVVTSWRTSPLGKLVFTTQEGQVWRQVDSHRVFPRGESFNATVSKGMLGSYFIQIDGIRRKIRVKRVR